MRVANKPIRVIPAKAGTQPRFFLSTSACLKNANWVPAFAGMTFRDLLIPLANKSLKPILIPQHIHPSKQRLQRLLIRQVAVGDEVEPSARL